MKISKREKILLVVVILLALGAVYYFYFLSPFMNEMKDINAKITEKEARLQTYSITAENYKLKNDLFAGEKVDPALRQLVKNEIDSLIYEISKVADYYWSRTSNPLGCVILTGGASLLHGLYGYFQSNVRITIYTPQALLKNHVAKKSFTDNDYAHFFNNYAASFREEAYK